MRRFIVFILILCLLPIMSSASYKEEVYESARAYADSIESLYDIKIIFDEECADNNLDDS